MGGNLVAKVLADNQARAAVDRILHESKAKVAELLADKRHVIEALAGALLERDELIDEEILEVIIQAERAAGHEVTVDLRTGQPTLDGDPSTTRHLN